MLTESAVGVRANLAPFKNGIEMNDIQSATRVLGHELATELSLAELELVSGGGLQSEGGGSETYSTGCDGRCSVQDGA